MAGPWDRQPARPELQAVLLELPHVLPHAGPVRKHRPLRMPYAAKAPRGTRDAHIHRKSPSSTVHPASRGCSRSTASHSTCARSLGNNTCRLWRWPGLAGSTRLLWDSKSRAYY